MTTTRVRPMVEGGILSAVAILFALISVYIPFIGAVHQFDLAGADHPARGATRL